MQEHQAELAAAARSRAAATAATAATAAAKQAAAVAFAATAATAAEAEAPAPIDYGVEDDFFIAYNPEDICTQARGHTAVLNKFKGFVTSLYHHLIPCACKR